MINTEIVLITASGPTIKKVTERRRKFNNICNYITTKPWILRDGCGVKHA